MPYIKKDRRGDLSPRETDMPKCPETSGEFNFVITEYINWIIDTRGESYQVYNDVIGALEGAKLELYRRKIVPYEDKKIIENGDVYE